jgi:membrane protein implicated in regulation of membrane protease activity
MSNQLGLSSLVLSIAVASIAVALGLRQWYERRVREADLGEDDRNYFVRQDLRRVFGVVVLLILAIGVLIGSRTAPQIAGHANLQFVAIWLVEFALIFLVLALALLDWLATRRYAQRQRRSMARERDEVLRGILGRTDPQRNGDPLVPGQDLHP